MNLALRVLCNTTTMKNMMHQERVTGGLQLIPLPLHSVTTQLSHYSVSLTPNVHA